MFKFIMGVISGVALVIWQPEILTWFVSSGLRDNIVTVLNGVQNEETSLDSTCCSRVSL